MSQRNFLSQLRLNGDKRKGGYEEEQWSVVCWTRLIHTIVWLPERVTNEIKHAKIPSVDQWGITKPHPRRGVVISDFREKRVISFDDMDTEVLIVLAQVEGHIPLCKWVPLIELSRFLFFLKILKRRHQRVRSDHMLIQSQFSWPWWAPIRSVTSSQWVDAPLTVLTSLLMFSLFLFFIWTLEAQSSALMWVSVSISIHWQMKVLWWYARYSSV